MARDLDNAHRRPDGADDATVEAAGTVSEAFELVVRARGRLYDFHQMIGEADFKLGDAADQLEAAGHPDLADLIRTEVIGHNVTHGRWTFQLIEEFDDGFYQAVRRAEEEVREGLMEGRRHVFEAELKEERRTHGRPGHEATP